MCIRDSTGRFQERTTVLDVRLDRVARRDAARLQWSAGAVVCPGAVAKGFQEGRVDLLQSDDCPSCVPSGLQSGSDRLHSGRPEWYSVDPAELDGQAAARSDASQIGHGNGM